MGPPFVAAAVSCIRRVPQAEEVEREAIRAALHHLGDLAAAARALGIHRRTLEREMKRYRLRAPR